MRLHIHSARLSTVVIASASETEERGFESTQGERYQAFLHRCIAKLLLIELNLSCCCTYVHMLTFTFCMFLI
jgi:hypothetical protein